MYHHNWRNCQCQKPSNIPPVFRETITPQLIQRLRSPVRDKFCSKPNSNIRCRLLFLNYSLRHYGVVNEVQGISKIKYASIHWRYSFTTDAAANTFIILWWSEEACKTRPKRTDCEDKAMVMDGAVGNDQPSFCDAGVVSLLAMWGWLGEVCSRGGDPRDEENLSSRFPFSWIAGDMAAIFCWIPSRRQCRHCVRHQVPVVWRHVEGFVDQDLKQPPPMHYVCLASSYYYCTGSTTPIVEWKLLIVVCCCNWANK